MPQQSTYHGDYKFKPGDLVLAESHWLTQTYQDVGLVIRQLAAVEDYPPPVLVLLSWHKGTHLLYEDATSLILVSRRDL